ncbi:MAG: hypothetical protein PUD39_06470 [Bacteroidales bacterium]|nr:hypothetical protein [Bacteroidales bacterium]
MNKDDLILAIQAAGVSRGRNGLRKDKGGEKLLETRKIYYSTEQMGLMPLTHYI